MMAKMTSRRKRRDGAKVKNGHAQFAKKYVTYGSAGPSRDPKVLVSVFSADRE